MSTDLTEDDDAGLARAGRPTEAPELFGDLVRRADRYGLAVPVLRFVADLAAAL